MRNRQPNGAQGTADDPSTGRPKALDVKNRVSVSPDGIEENFPKLCAALKTLLRSGQLFECAVQTLNTELTKAAYQHSAGRLKPIRPHNHKSERPRSAAWGMGE